MQLALRIRDRLPANGRSILIWSVTAWIWAAGQLATTGMVAWVAHAHQRSLSSAVDSWDALILARIAGTGYVWTGPKVTDPAFFPALPMSMRVVTAVTGWSPLLAGRLLAMTGGVVFAFGLMALVRSLAGSRRTGWILVGLAAVSPLSIVFQMAYTEPVFCALAVWCMVALQRDRWLTAGTLAALGGLVRPSGPALIAAVVLAAILAVVRHRFSRRALVAIVIAPLGTAGYLAYVAVKVGRLTAYFQAEELGWGTKFDGGRSTVEFVRNALVSAPSVLDVVVAGLLVLAVVLLPFVSRLPMGWPMVAYVAVVLASDVFSTGIMNSKVRLLLPAFPLLIPVSMWLSRQPRTALLAVGFLLILGGTWYSAYGLIIYGHAI